MTVNFDPARLTPPRVSLLSSAEVVTTSGDRWWADFHVHGIGDASVGSGVFPICRDDETRTAAGDSGSHVFYPFMVFASERCSTWGGTDVDWKDRARQKLSVVEPWWVERVLWEGTADAGPAADNPSFVGSETNTLVTSADPLGGFALLDATVAQDLHDGRGMIHVAPRTFVVLQQYDIIRREGNVWFSALDNIVVPGRGYTGNGPDPDGGENANAATGTVEWMFGHAGMVRVRRSEIMTLPEGEITDEMLRNTNDLIVWAQRVVGLEVHNGNAEDGSTEFYSVSVDLSAASGTGGIDGGTP